MNNVRPGIILDTVIDEAFCTGGLWEIRLEKAENPQLNSRATLSKIGVCTHGVVAISCDDLRSHYRRHFGIKEGPPKIQEESHDYDDFEDDHWGDEYLEGCDTDDEADLRPEVSPTAKEYLDWKMSVLLLIQAKIKP